MASRIEVEPRNEGEDPFYSVAHRTTEQAYQYSRPTTLRWKAFDRYSDLRYWRKRLKEDTGTSQEEGVKAELEKAVDAAKKGIRHKAFLREFMLVSRWARRHEQHVVAAYRRYPDVPADIEQRAKNDMTEAMH